MDSIPNEIIDSIFRYCDIADGPVIMAVSKSWRRQYPYSLPDYYWDQVAVNKFLTLLACREEINVTHRVKELQIVTPPAGKWGILTGQTLANLVPYVINVSVDVCNMIIDFAIAVDQSADNEKPLTTESSLIDSIMTRLDDKRPQLVVAVWRTPVIRHWMGTVAIDGWNIRSPRFRYLPQDFDNQYSGEIIRLMDNIHRLTLVAYNAAISGNADPKIINYAISQGCKLNWITDWFAANNISSEVGA
ncbi:MAG: hypothetical protein WDA28_13300, partial [Castellaniella sp.]